MLRPWCLNDQLEFTVLDTVLCPYSRSVRLYDNPTSTDSKELVVDMSDADNSIPIVWL